MCEHKQLPMRKFVHKLRCCTLWTMPLNPFLKEQKQAKIISNKMAWQAINLVLQTQPIVSAKYAKSVRKSPFNRPVSARRCTLWSMPLNPFLKEQKQAKTINNKQAWQAINLFL